MTSAASEQGPFVAVLVSELTPRDDYSTRSTRNGALRIVDRHSFDAFMAELAPALAIQVDHPLSGRPERIDLHFTSLKDFRPAELCERTTPLRSLLEAERAVARGGNVRGELERLLPDGPRRDALIASLDQRAPAKAATGAESAKDSALERLFSQVDVAPTAVAPASPAGTASAREELGTGLTRLIDAVLTHPEVSRLEAAWRGLSVLVKDASARGVVLAVANVGQHDGASAVRSLLAREPGLAVDLIAVDREFGGSAQDGERLREYAELGEELSAPVIAAAEPSLLGADDIDELARAERAWGAHDDPRAAYLRSLSAKDVSRWLALTVNRILGRAAWDKETARLRDVTVSQLGGDVWLNGPFAIVTVAARSFLKFGFASALTGAEHGLLQNRPVRIVSDRGHEAALPVEVFMSTEAQSELGRAGIIALGSAKNHDAVIITSANVVFRGPKVEIGANVAAELGLGDQLFVGRLARIVQQLAAALPATGDAEANRQVAVLTLSELFANARPPGPELDVSAASGRLVVTVHPRRFAEVRLPEVTLAAKLAE